MSRAKALQEKLEQVLERHVPMIIACSGGIDSMLLATVAHRRHPEHTLVVHTISPAVPLQAGQRIRHAAAKEKWNLKFIRSGEFESKDYLANPVDRCYHCKSHLYDAIEGLRQGMDGFAGASMLSGANCDDLKDYRPGLQAAQEHYVYHPYIEAGMDKEAIRILARHLDLSFSELPASPCLSSRVYTGTGITAQRLQAIDIGEMLLKESTGLDVVRCRVQGNTMKVEVKAGAQSRINDSLLRELEKRIKFFDPALEQVVVDSNPYAQGRAVIRTP
jgi:uncharacterized protein